MMPLFIALGLGLGLALALVPLARVLALAFGLVDRPDGHRKMHQKATPVTGGLAVFYCAVAATLVALLLSRELADSVADHSWELLGLMLGCLVICTVGVVDDFRRLRGIHKLAGQIVAVSVVIAFGVTVHKVHIFGFDLELDWFGAPFTAFLLLGAINSLNLIDGMDGLLGSVGVILSLALAAMAFMSGHTWAAVVAMALAGALLGFLRYNLPPASIFLGDAGSMMVGLVLGTLAIRCSLKGPATIALALPIALLVLPIFDTTAAIVRRKLTGRSIYTTDRGHLHHCLLRDGWSNSGVLMVVAACCLLTCAGVLASQAFKNEWIALVTAGSIIATLVLTRLFGHAEAMLIKAKFMSLLKPNGNARHMEVRLQGSVAWKDLWHDLKGLASDLHLRQVLLDVNAPALHEGYHARWENGQERLESPQYWYAEIPLTTHGMSVGRLVMAGLPDEQPVWNKIAVVMKVVEAFTHPEPESVAMAPRAAGTIGETVLAANDTVVSVVDRVSTSENAGLTVEPIHG